MSDRIITRAISPYVSWQGPEAACQTFSDEDVQRNKFKHEGIAVNTRHYAPCRTQSVGYDLVHSYEGTTENAKHVNLNFSPPEISFKTSAHAYECGYRDGLKAAQAFAPPPKMMLLVYQMKGGHHGPYMRTGVYHADGGVWRPVGGTETVFPAPLEGGAA